MQLRDLSLKTVVATHLKGSVVRTAALEALELLEGVLLPSLVGKAKAEDSGRALQVLSQPGCGDALARPAAAACEEGRAKARVTARGLHPLLWAVC